MKRLFIATLAPAVLILLALPLVAHNPLRSKPDGSPSSFVSDEPPGALHRFDPPATPVRKVPAAPAQESHNRSDRQTASGPSSQHVVESQTFTVVSTTYKVAGSDVQNGLVTFLKQYLGKPGLFEITSKDDDKITVFASPKAQKTIGDLIALMKQSPRTTWPAVSDDVGGDYGAPFVPVEPSP